MRPTILGDRRGPASPPWQRPLKQRSRRPADHLSPRLEITSTPTPGRFTAIELTLQDCKPKKAEDRLRVHPQVRPDKLELSVEKGTKEGKDFQALQEKHSQVLTECQLKLKSHVIEAGDLDVVKKKKLTVVSFVESIHDISEGFLTYDDRQDITSHQCSVDLV